MADERSPAGAARPRVPLHPVGGPGHRRLPHRPARRDDPGGASHDAEAARVVVPPTEYDPDHRRGRGRAGRGGPVRRGHDVVVGGDTPEGPAPRPALRLGARPARRGRHGHAPRRRRRLARGHGERHAGDGPLAPARPSAMGTSSDIECFVPEGAVVSDAAPSPTRPSARPPSRCWPRPIRIDYQFTAGLAQSRFLKGIAEGKFLGQRCPKCQKVYVPPRGSCPTDGVATTDEVELAQHRDGDDLLRRERALPGPVHRDPLHLRPDPPRRGQHRLHGPHPGDPDRPRSAWACGWRRCGWTRTELGPTMASVKYFRPTGEPDAAYETFKEYL